MAEPMNVEEPPPTLPQSSTSHAPAEAIAATGDATPRRSEFKYAQRRRQNVHSIHWALQEIQTLVKRVSSGTPSSASSGHSVRFL